MAPVVVVVVAVVPLLLLLRRFLNPTAINLPPGPRPLPVLGNILTLLQLLTEGYWKKSGASQRPLHAALALLSETHGPLFHLRLGTQDLVVASSPEAAASVLRDQDRILSGRHVPATYRVPAYADHSLVWSARCDSRWMSLRHLCRFQLFSSRSLDSGAPSRQKKADELVAFLGGNVGQEVKLAELVFSTVFNMFGNTVISRDVLAAGGLAEEEGGGVWDLKTDMERALQLGNALNVEDCYPALLAGWDPQGLRAEVAGSIKRFYGLLDWITRNRKREVAEEGSSGEERDDFFEILLKAGLGDLQINAFVEDIFTAGTDTTTNSFEWTMAELLKNPRALAKVREEIEALVGDPKKKERNALNESDLSQLRYLHACVKESLRLHPPAPLLLPRHASDSCQAMGYTIPKGSMILVNYWAIGRDPKSWEDPLTFLPERFLAGCERDYKGMDFEFIPFGSGRRVCPGLPLATRMIALLLASLVHNFDWSLPGGRDLSELSMEERPGLVLQRKEPLILIPKPRI